MNASVSSRVYCNNINFSLESLATSLRKLKQSHLRDTCKNQHRCIAAPRQASATASKPIRLMIITIRPRTDADLDACVEVMAAVYANDGYPVEGMEGGAAFLGAGPAWVAEREGEVIGHISIKEAKTDDVSVALWWDKHPGDRIAVLGRLMVHPEKRGGGSASRLIEAGTDWARENHRRLVLFGLAHNAAALRLYKRLDWVDFGETVFVGSDGKQWPATCYASPSRID